jgi:hypothetical protein
VRGGGVLALPSFGLKLVKLEIDGTKLESLEIEMMSERKKRNQMPNEDKVEMQQESQINQSLNR